MIRRRWCLLLTAVLVLPAYASDDGMIDCVVVLTEYLTDQPFHEEFDGEHMHYRLPIATFVVVDHADLDGRQIRIAFFRGEYDEIFAASDRGVGRQFVLRLPLDYFDYPDGTLIRDMSVEGIAPADTE